MLDTLVIRDDIRGLIPKLDLIIALLNRLSNQEKTMAIDLTKLTAEIAANTNVTASVEALVSRSGSADCRYSNIDRPCHAGRS